MGRVGNAQVVTCLLGLGAGRPPGPDQAKQKGRVGPPGARKRGKVGDPE